MMKHLRKFENIPYTEQDNPNKINLDRVDIKEICPECGKFAMHLYEYSALYCPEKYKEGEVNFDNEMYAGSRCDNCGFTLSEYGTIKWNIKEKEKRLKFLEMYKQGIEDPSQIKKFNL